jgi:hypothetical protein
MAVVSVSATLADVRIAAEAIPPTSAMRMGVGMVVWDQGLVTVAATDLLSPPRVIGGQLLELVT